MGYTLAKPMRVQKTDGSVELRRAGAPCPEADTWPNAAVWIQRGFLRPDDHETALASGYARDKLQPARVATPEDIARGSWNKVPELGKPLPDLPDSLDSKTELSKMARADLEKLAQERGVLDPESYPNKPALAAAVLATEDTTRAELLGLGRAEMEKLAIDQGIESPSDFLSDIDLADAILASAEE